MNKPLHKICFVGHQNFNWLLSAVQLQLKHPVCQFDEWVSVCHIKHQHRPMHSSEVGLSNGAKSKEIN